MRTLRHLLLAAAAILLSASSFAEELTGVLGAFGDEIRMIKDSLKDKEACSYLGIKFVKGTLNGRHVVVAETGVGKVNAAMTTAVMIDRFHPVEVLFTGIAGGIAEDLKPGDLVIGERLVQHDLGLLAQDGFKLEGERNPANGVRNPVYFKSDERLVGYAKLAFEKTRFISIDGEAPKLKTGLIATGDCFVASDAKKAELQKNLDAQAVEMEGGAVAQICYQQSVPFIVIRSISDKADANAKTDIKSFYITAAENSARLVGAIAETIEKDSRNAM